MAAPALAWSHNGHMAIAYRAYTQLTPSARSRANALLTLNPAFGRWTMFVPSGVSSWERSAMLFAIAATWPDQIKDDGKYSDDGADNGNRPSGPSASRNVGYSDTLRHKYWHFVDQPFTRDGTRLPVIPDPNARSRIRLFRSVIASNATDDLKSYDLVWLLHLIGDVHQPLHCATRASANLPRGDSGGNLVSVCEVPCQAITQNLHAYWDSVLGGGFSVVDAVALARSLPSADAKRGTLLDEAVWVQESFELAQSRVYRSPIESGAGPFIVTAAYRRATAVEARGQVSLAAARLASVLNGELK